MSHLSPTKANQFAALANFKPKQTTRSTLTDGQKKELDRALKPSQSKHLSEEEQIEIYTKRHGVTQVPEYKPRRGRPPKTTFRQPYYDLDRQDPAEDTRFDEGQKKIVTIKDSDCHSGGMVEQLTVIDDDGDEDAECVRCESRLKIEITNDLGHRNSISISSVDFLNRLEEVLTNGECAELRLKTKAGSLSISYATIEEFDE